MQVEVKNLPQEYKDFFISDGCVGLPKPLRSPWLDYQEKRRRGNKRDYFSNVWGVCLGTTDAVFDQITLDKIKTTTVREPDYQGEVVFSYDSHNKTCEERFIPNYGKQRLQWWGSLFGGRPDQTHNYIMAFDISFGLGASNSVIEIYDCNIKDQVGEWVDASTREHDLADIGVAIAKWVGGYDPCFLIWENNGGQGSTFRQRVLFQDYYTIYFRKKEEAKYRKASDMYGWRSNTTNKSDLLAGFGVALSCGVNKIENFNSITIHSIDLLDELYDYVWFENGDAGTSCTKDIKSGAKSRHGDRVIAAGLCVLASKDQLPGKGRKITLAPVNSFIYRFQKYLDEQDEQRRNSKLIWKY